MKEHRSAKRNDVSIINNQAEMEVMNVNILDKNHQDEIEQLLFKLIEIESHQDIKGHEKDVTQFIYSYFKERGIEVELQHVIDGRCNVIARVRGNGSGPTLLLNGHTDTVPPYEMENPFFPIKKDGKIYGRGSVDMKGALATMMVVLSTLKRESTLLNGDVVFAGTIGEESYSPGADFLRRSNEPIDYCIVGEPTNMEIGIAHKGVVWGQAEFKGVSVHGSVPEEGVNAIYKATKWINAVLEQYIPEIKKKHHPILGSPSFNIGEIHGGTRPVIVPNSCVVKFEQRLLPGEKEEDVIVNLQNIVEKLSEKDSDIKGKVTEMSVFHGVPHRALETSPTSRLVTTISEVYKEFTHIEKKPVGLGFWTDGALLADMGADVVVCGPGSINQAHSNNEFISCDQLTIAYNIYLLTALKICGKEDNDESYERFTVHSV